MISLFGEEPISAIFDTRVIWGRELRSAFGSLGPYFSSITFSHVKGSRRKISSKFADGAKIALLEGDQVWGKADFFNCGFYEISCYAKASLSYQADPRRLETLLLPFDLYCMVLCVPS